MAIKQVSDLFSTPYAGGMFPCSRQLPAVYLPFNRLFKLPKLPLIAAGAGSGAVWGAVISGSTPAANLSACVPAKAPVRSRSAFCALHPLQQGAAGAQRTQHCFYRQALIPRMRCVCFIC